MSCTLKQKGENVAFMRSFDLENVDPNSRNLHQKEFLCGPLPPPSLFQLFWEPRQKWGGHYMSPSCNARNSQTLSSARVNVPKKSDIRKVGIRKGKITKFCSYIFFSQHILTVARLTGFLHMYQRPRSGWLVRPSHRFAPQLSYSSAKKTNNKRIGRYKAQGLVPKLRVSCQPVTSQVRSVTHKSGFYFGA